MLSSPRFATQLAVALAVITLAVLAFSAARAAHRAEHGDCTLVLTMSGQECR